MGVPGSGGSQLTMADRTERPATTEVGVAGTPLLRATQVALGYWAWYKQVSPWPSQYCCSLYASPKLK